MTMGKRMVKVPHLFKYLIIIRTDHYPVRFHKVFNGSSFFQKFRIRDYMKWYFKSPLVQFFLNGLLYFVSGSYRNC